MFLWFDRRNEEMYYKWMKIKLNKRVRVFLVVLFESLMTSLEYNYWWYITTEHMTDITSVTADSESLPAAPGRWHRTAEPRNWIIISRRRPLEPTQIFRVYFVPARCAQPADSDFFSRRPLSRSPPGGFTSWFWSNPRKPGFLLHTENGLKKY